MSNNRERELFEAALDLSAEERGRFLDEECEGQPGLRNRIELLLRSEAMAGDFLKTQGVTGDSSDDGIEEEVGSMVGSYKLLQKVGEGGFGVVYMAEQTEPMVRRVALKIIKLGLETKQVVGRFEAERQALAMMDHPNIAKVLDAGTTERGRPYFVMELVRGIPITQYCDQANLSVKDRINLFMRVCQAVQHAHHKGIIHRDLKPNNVLVTLHDGDPVPKVIDFGIAKATQQKLTDKTVFTQLLQFIGTPAYMSPEQAELSGLDIDTRSDIYSLGVMLYELLAGRTPFDGNELVRAGLDAMRRTIREKEPPKLPTALSTFDEQNQSQVAHRRSSEPRKLSHLLSGELDWITMRAMEKDRSRRYETANAFRADLNRYLAGEAVQAVAPSSIYRARKFVSRHRVGVSVTVGVAILLVVSSLITGISWWKAARASEGRAAALGEKEAALQVALIESENARRAEQEALGHARELGLQRYVSDINTAYEYYRDGNLKAARERLIPHFSLAEPNRESDLRGFEWRYLWKETGGDQLRRLEGHDGNVVSLAVSPDDRWLASGGLDGTVRIWDWRGNKQIHLFKCPKAVFTLEFTGDGNYLLAGFQGGIWTWHVSGDQFVDHIKRDGSFRATISPRGHLVAHGDEESRLQLWDIRDGKEHRLREEMPSCSWWPRFSKDGQLVVLLAAEETSIWSFPDLKLQQTLDFTNMRHPNNWFDFVFDPTGDYLLEFSGSGGLLLWDWREKTASKPELLKEGVGSLAYTPDNSLLVVSGQRHDVNVYDAKTFQRLNSFEGHLGSSGPVVIMHDGHHVVSGGSDGILVWDLRKDNKPELIPVDSLAFGQSPLFSNSGRYVAVLGGRMTNMIHIEHEGIQVYDLQRRNSFALDAIPYPLGFQSDDDLFLGFPRRKDLSGPEIIRTGIPSHIVTYDLSGRLVKEVPMSFDRNATAMCGFSPEKGWFTMADAVGVIELIDVASGDMISRWSTDGDSVVATRFSPDSRWLASMALRTVESGKPQKGYPYVKLWNLSDPNDIGQPIVLNHSSRETIVNVVAFSPDTRWVALSGLDSKISIWSIPEGKRLQTLEGHQKPVNSLDFSPDGRTLVSGGDEGIFLWNTATWRELMVFRDLGVIGSVGFSPVGDSLVYTSSPTLGVNKKALGVLRAPFSE